MIRVADYIMARLAEHGVRHVFMVAGGGAMYLNNALGGEKRIKFICNHHEQACAMAAEGYARISGGVGLIVVTSGPGGINSLNGVFGAWTDSIPLLILSGQVKRETCLSAYNIPGLRQLGDQEADIINMVRGITKYAVMVTEPTSIRYHLERALFIAESGRPGPVWLDIPVDVQGAYIDEDSLEAYDSAEDEPVYDMETVSAQCREIVSRLCSAERPVMMLGTGVRLAKAEHIMEKVIRRLQIPVTTAWTHDVIASDDPLFCGRPGTIGTRAGNFVVQNADFLLVIGSRLNIRQVSYNWQAFARFAFKVQVDADSSELHKPTVKPDMPVHCDARLFLEQLDRELDNSGYDPRKHREWLEWCKERLRRYPPVLPKHRSGLKLNPYEFVDYLIRALGEDDIIVCGNATACIVPFQTAFLKKGQRMFSNSGAASMGYDLPASIGAALAGGSRRVICFAGDGSIQMNIQEFQTICHHALPIKVFVMNNGGYLSIRLTQSTFFQRFVGESPFSGVTFPDIVKVASAYGLPAARIERENFTSMVEWALSHPGPVVCDVVLDETQAFEPRLKARELPDGTIVSPALEDMFPFLERDELLENLRIPPYNDTHG